VISSLPLAPAISATPSELLPSSKPKLSISYNRFLYTSNLASPAGLLGRPNKEDDIAQPNLDHEHSNMSYASAVKDHGPPQPLSEVSKPSSSSLPPPSLRYTDTNLQKAAPPIPEIEHSESGERSVDSLSSDTVNIPSYAEQQKAVEDRAHKLAQEGEEAFDRIKGQARRGYEDATADGRRAKEEGRKAEEWAERNKGNPVVIGNVVVVTALAGLLGTGAYRMHKAGTLTWQVAGAWAGVVGLFAAGDYYVSQ